MRRNLPLLALLLIVLAVFLAALANQSPAAVFGAAATINGQAVGAVWEPNPLCGTFPAAAFSMPGSDSSYVRGLQALSAGDNEQAAQHFTRAVEQQQHPLALIFLANLTAEADEAAIYPGRWTDEMRMALAEYYLVQAGRCEIAGEHETAREALARGERFLPAEGISALPLGVARSASVIYLADQNWAAALPWLEHASAANDSALLSLADVLFRLGRLEEAATTYERALIYYPQRGTTRLHAAQVAVALGDVPGALAILEVMDDPFELGTEGLLLWADLCGQLADPACQELQYRRVLEIEPANETAINGLQAIQP